MVGKNPLVGNIEYVHPKEVGKAAPTVQARPAMESQQQPVETTVAATASLGKPERSQHFSQSRTQMRVDATTGSDDLPSSSDKSNILDSTGAVVTCGKESVGDNTSSRQPEASKIVSEANSAEKGSSDLSRGSSYRAGSSTYSQGDEERTAFQTQAVAVNGPSCNKKGAVKTNIAKKPAKMTEPESPVDIRKIAPDQKLLNQGDVSSTAVNKQRSVAYANVTEVGVDDADISNFSSVSSKRLTGEFSVHCPDLTTKPIYNVGVKHYDKTLLSTVCENYGTKRTGTYYDAKTSEYYVRSSVSPRLSHVDPERHRVDFSTRAANSVAPKTWRIKPQVEFGGPSPRDFLDLYAMEKYPLDSTYKYIRKGCVDAEKIYTEFMFDGYIKVDRTEIDNMISGRLFDFSRSQHCCVAIYVKIWLQVFRLRKAERDGIQFLVPPTVTDLNAYFTYVPYPVTASDLEELIKKEVVTYLSPLDICNHTSLSIMLMLATEGPGWDFPKDARIGVADDFEWPVIPLGLLCTKPNQLPRVSPETPFQPVIPSVRQMIAFMNWSPAATGDPSDAVTGFYIASSWWCSNYEAAPAWAPYPGDGERIPPNEAMPKWRDLPVHRVGYVPSADDRAVLGAVVGAREGNPNPAEWADLGHLLEYTDPQNPRVRIPVPSIFVPVDSVGLGFCVKRLPAPRGFNPLHRLLKLRPIVNILSEDWVDMNTKLTYTNPDIAATTIGTIFGSIGSTLLYALNLTGREVSALMGNAHGMPTGLQEAVRALRLPADGSAWVSNFYGPSAAHDAVCAVMMSRVPPEVNVCSDWLKVDDRAMCTPVNMYAAYNSYNHTPTRGPVMCIDNLLRCRPIEWGIPTPYAEYNFDAELWCRHDGFRPYRGVEGELQRMAAGLHPYSLVAYNALALNFVLHLASTYMGSEPPPALVNDVFDVHKSMNGKNSRGPRQEVRRVQPVWNALLYCYEPTTLNTYDWESGTITIASLADSRYQRIACGCIHKGGVSSSQELLVGFKLECSTTGYPSLYKLQAELAHAVSSSLQNSYLKDHLSQDQGKRGNEDTAQNEDEQSAGTSKRDCTIFRDIRPPKQTNMLSATGRTYDICPTECTGHFYYE